MRAALTPVAAKRCAGRESHPAFKELHRPHRELQGGSCAGLKRQNNVWAQQHLQESTKPEPPRGGGSSRGGARAGEGACTCGLGSDQRWALQVVMQGDDADSVLGAGPEATQLRGVIFTVWGREELADSILRGGVGHPVPADLPLWAFPSNFDGINIHIREC